jgi:CRP-like cAMP-binding protein
MKNQELNAFLREKVKLSLDEIDLFIASAKKITLGKKDFFIEKGKKAPFKGYIQKGCTRTFFTDENIKENIIFFSFEGDWIGDIESYHLNSPSRVSIQCIEDCELLVWSKDSFERLIERISTLKNWYDYTAVRMYSNMFEKLIESKIRNVEEKYLYLLNKYPEHLQRVPAQYIADYLEIEPQSYSRLKRRIFLNKK